MFSRRDKNFVWRRVDARSFDLKGMKVAIVGGTGGIGRAFSRFLASRGADVLAIGQTHRDSDVPGIEFIKADLSLMREAQRVGSLLPAETLDLVIFTNGIFAAQADFCRVFESDMNRLYMPSFLLTGNHAMAEKCFVQGLEDAVNGNNVFREWAQSWARRTVIQNAIQMIRPRTADISSPRSASREIADGLRLQPADFTAILELAAFDRFVFVMSVLECYSDQECSLPLNCTRADVAAARIRAMQEIGQSAEGEPCTC